MKNKVFSAFHGAKHNFSNVAKNGQVSNNQGESHTIILALTSNETQLTHENDWIFKNNFVAFLTEIQYVLYQRFVVNLIFMS